VPDTLKPTTPEPGNHYNYVLTMHHPFSPKVTTEADAIPGEDDLCSRWVTVAAVDNTD
jgi:hypothetical protein